MGRILECGDVMGWAKEQIDKIGMQRLLQDLIDELEQNIDIDYLNTLRENLQKAQDEYIGRYDND